jgi:hypothetical protein
VINDRFEKVQRDGFEGNPVVVVAELADEKHDGPRHASSEDDELKRTRRRQDRRDAGRRNRILLQGDSGERGGDDPDEVPNIGKEDRLSIPLTEQVHAQAETYKAREEVYEAMGRLQESPGVDLGE